MGISKNDFDELPELTRLVNKIAAINKEYANQISEEIFQKQPYFLTILLGYRLDTTALELEEIMKIYFLIWEYFRSNNNVQTIKVSETSFESSMQKHIEMMNYAEGESGQDAQMQIFSADLKELKSKALFTAILFQFNNILVLNQMEKRKRGIILMNIKCFIMCFERL